MTKSPVGRQARKALKRVGLAPRSEFDPVASWPKPKRADCDFYHAMSFANGESVEGPWDIRGRFEQYIGGYPLKGKTVLDVGTAGGFLAFEAERAGARVTALDALSGEEFQRIQFRRSTAHRDRQAFVAESNVALKQLKQGFWYAWHSNSSAVEVVYAPLARLPYWDRKFDVVIAGAILEHLPDPVTVIGNLARLAREALIISFTLVDDSDDQFMKTATPWTDRRHSFTFWTLSRGLYQRVFKNLGFSVEFTMATALRADGEQVRPTLIARRIPAKELRRATPRKRAART